MKVNVRKAFTEKLLELAESDERIFMTATDSRGSVTCGGFAERFPLRFIECGIAEQNSVGIAAGLARTGKTVFTAGPACFLSARAYEQIKLDVAYNNTNVKVIGVSAGASYGPLGASHTTLHDFACMRALPNIEVFAPCDDMQMQFLTEYLAQSGRPAYVRMGRGDVDRVYSEKQAFEAGKAVTFSLSEDAQRVRNGKRQFETGRAVTVRHEGEPECVYDGEQPFEAGRAVTVRCGDDVTLIACGETVSIALGAAEMLARDGISARVLDMFTLKPFDDDAVRRACAETRGIVTVEEHSRCGGLGEAACAVACETGAKARIIALPQEIPVGNPKEIFDYCGLTRENCAAQAKLVIM